MDSFYIPKTLDAPHRIIIWTVAEFVSFALPGSCLFFFYDSPIAAIAVGSLCLIGYKKIRTRLGPQFLMCFLLWYLPDLGQFRVLPAMRTRVYLSL